MSDPRHSPSRHLTEAALMQWLDEPGEVVEAGVREHLAGCAPCRDQADALRRIFAELAAARSPADPAASDAALRAQRDRIAHLVGGPRRADFPEPLPSAVTAPASPVTALRRPRRWIQLAAAASLAALVVFTTDRLAREQGRDDATGDTTSASRGDVAVVTAAEEAAEDAVAIAGRDSAPVAAMLAELELATFDPGSPAALDEQLVIEDAFAALPPDDQAAILNELAMLTFDDPLERP